MASLITSDKSITGDITKAKIVSKRKPWRDLDLSLKVHPIRKDIIPLKDDVAIKNAVKNLLITNFFERPFQPALGANLKALLFEPADYITRIDMRQGIVDVLTKYEPRIDLLKVEIKDLADQNAYNIIVFFRIKEYDAEDKVEIILRRLK